MMPKFKFAEGCAVEDVSSEDVGEMAFAPFKTDKGKLLVGSMVELGWKLKNYSALARDTISLVGKSTGVLEVTLGSFAP